MKQRYVLNLLIMLFLLALSIPAYAAEDTSYAEKVSHIFQKTKESEVLLQPLLDKDFVKFYEILKTEHLKSSKYAPRSILHFHVDTWTKDKERNKLILNALSEMEKQYPNDALFLTVKGMILFDLAYLERGTDWARNTSEEQFKKFDQLKLLARNDLEKALTINPKNPEAWSTLIDITVTYPGNHHHEIFKKAYELYPGDYGIYQSYLRGLKPRWGGSTELALAFSTNAYVQSGKGSPMGSLIIESMQDASSQLESIKNEINDTNLKPQLGQDFIKKIFTKTIDLKQRETIEKNWSFLSTTYNEVIEKNPNMIETIRMFAYIEWDIEKFEEASEKLNKIIEIDPGYSEYIYYMLGGLKEKSKNYEEALLYYEIAGQIFTDSSKAKDMQARMLSYLDRRQESAEIYKILVEKNPENHIYWASLCSELSGIGKEEEALNACDKAIQIDPKYAWSYHLKGWTLKFAGKEQEGELLIQKAKELGWGGYKNQ